MTDPAATRRRRPAYALLALGVFALATLALRYGDDLLVARLGERPSWATATLLKAVATIALPLGVLAASPRLRAAAGVPFGLHGGALRLAGRSMAPLGPACVGFAVVGALGSSPGAWSGALAMTGVFLAAAALLPWVTRGLPAADGPARSTGRAGSWLLLEGAALTAVLSASGLLEALPPVAQRALTLVFVVAVGEELLFRGVVQPALNLALGRPFRLGGVAWGWGLPLAALLFGLVHALVPTPLAWPLATFTAAGGLALGYVRERDGTLLAPVLVHALLDLPLWFVGG